jgi:hypothetical protein
MNFLHCARACIAYLVSVQPFSDFILMILILVCVFIQNLYLWFWFWFWSVFSFRMWNQPWCVHNHATDPSIAMHVVVCILFVLCLVPVSQQHAVGSCVSECQPLAGNCSIKLNAIHSMRRGAGRGKPEGRQQLPISLGFTCAHCGGDFGSRTGMDCHRRHRNSVGTPCADPMNSKSMSFTGRADQYGGILRRHDTLGVMYILSFVLQKILTCHTENRAIIAIIDIIDIMLS